MKKSDKGFIYLLEDQAFPEQIKIGYTKNLEKRLQHFNRNKPFNTAKFIYKSEEQENVIQAYNAIVGPLILNHEVWQATKGLNSSWYSMTHKHLIIESIKNWLNG